MKKIHKISIVVIVLILIGLFTLNIKSSPISSDIKMGAVLALTGYAAADGENIKNGIELAKTDLKKDGVNATIEYYDDGTDPKRTVAGVIYMNSKGIKTIFGPTWSFQISAALPTLNKNNVIAYIADSSSDIVDGAEADKQNLIFGVSPIYQIEVPSTTWLRNNNVKNVAIITLDGTWGIAHTDAWVKSVNNARSNIALKEMFTYATEVSVISSLVQKAKANNADGIMWSGTEAGAIVLVKKMRELDYNVPVLATGQLALAVNGGKVEIKELNISVIESEISKEFRKKYKAVYGTEPSKYAESSYDLTIIAAKTELEKGNKSAKDYVVSKEHKGYTDKYSFNASGDITNLAWVVNRLK